MATEHRSDYAPYRKSGVYKILNLTNGKVYVGGTIDFGKRKRSHFRAMIRGTHSNQYLQRAFNKYGIESLVFIVIEECEQSAIIQREQFWIDALDAASRPVGYNICPRADRREMSEETKQKLREAVTGFRHTQETKQLISASSKRRRMTPAQRQQSSERQKGKVISTEQRAKISDTLRGRTQSAESKKKKSETLKAILATPEAKAKKAEIMRQRWAAKRALPPDEFQKSCPGYGKTKSPAARAKLSDAITIWHARRKETKQNDTTPATSV